MSPTKDDHGAAVSASHPLAQHKVAVLAGAGAVFGYAMNKGQVHIPDVILGQPALQPWTMATMFTGALGMSLVSAALVRFAAPALLADMQTKRLSSPSSAAVLTAGGLLLGAGMAISGSCPGTVYVQLGALAPSAGPCLVGTALGTYVAGVAQPWITRLQGPWPKVATIVPWQMSTHAVAGVGAVALSVGLDLWLSEPVPAHAWRPSLAGFVVGSLQLPLMLFVQKMLGASTTMRIVLGHASSALGLGLSRVADASQGILVLGVVAGSFAAQGPGRVVGPAPLPSFVGGVLMALGSRVAGGCTLGHGLSGAAMLMQSSWLVIPAIFLGAIATAALQNALF